uniref:ornithine decarboxylase-like isoform X1 n=1 Tax=Myxine glutinosa TaxID=7769 RepID=UPI00358FD4D0
MTHAATNAMLKTVTLLKGNVTSADTLEGKLNAMLQDERDAFFVADMGEILHKHLRWHEALPRVAPFYAVKYNDKPPVIRTLACLGAGFDCTSKNEIDLVLQNGVIPERIIFGNPCKKASHIKHAAARGVHTMVFDCEDELEKVARIHPTARLVLRIPTTSEFELSSENERNFKVDMKLSMNLLLTAKRLGLNVIGLSFHFPSSSYFVKFFVQAIIEARSIVEMAKKLEISLKLLDIGGGFHGKVNGVETFEEVALKVKEALDTNFPKGSNIHMIAEPGRYYVQSAITLAANIIAKKSETTDGKCSFMYFLNDGIYSSFFGVMYNRCTVIKPLSLKGENEVTFQSTLWGHTCAGGDCIAKNCFLPELSTGDWLIFKNMGAYSMTTWSMFNGYSPPECEFVMAQNDWETLQILPEAMKTFVPLEDTGLHVPLCCVQKS